MNFSFQETIILIGILTTNVIAVITALNSGKNHLNTHNQVAEVKSDTISIERNTNSTLTLLQNKVDLLIEALQKSELLRLSESKTVPPVVQPVIVVPPTPPKDVAS